MYLHRLCTITDKLGDIHHGVVAKEDGDMLRVVFLQKDKLVYAERAVGEIEIDMETRPIKPNREVQRLAVAA